MAEGAPAAGRGCETVALCPKNGSGLKLPGKRRQTLCSATQPPPRGRAWAWSVCVRLRTMRASPQVVRWCWVAMPHYLLPCACGQRVTVTTAQAGSRVRCGCGRMLDVPTLRGLSRLEVAGAGREGPHRRTWGPLRGGLFAGGLLVAAAGLVLVAFYGARSLQLSALAVDRSAEVVREEAAYIDQRTPAELLDLWKAERDEGLGESRMPIWVAAQQRRRLFHFWMAVGAGGVVLGVAAAAAAVVGQHRAGTSPLAP